MYTCFAIIPHRCGSNKTLSQYSSSSAAVISPWELTVVPVHKQLHYLIWIQQVSPLAHRFQSLSLLHDCAVCTENVKFSFCLLMPCCPHKSAHLTCEIQCVCKLIEGNWNAHYIRWSYFSYSLSPLLYLGNPTDVKMKKSYNSLCMLAYTDIEKEMDFSSIAAFVFALANIGMMAKTFCIHVCEHRFK